MACLGENTMVDLLEQRLRGERLASVHRHLEECEPCRELVAASAGALDASIDIADEPTHIDPPAMALESNLGPGSRVDHYRIERLLGQGGMGEVFQAEDTNLQRKVALKVIKSEMLADAKGYEMFLTEARATARLAHPNIVTIHAVGAYQGQPYVALELLVGRTLRDRLLMGPMESAEIVKIALAIAEAMVAAHEARVFHRDLKPSNVMLGADGRTRVLDFGLAVIAELDVLAAVRDGQVAATLDETIALTGTPAYMAPEQWGPARATGAVDVWALGVLMFEMATRLRPYDHLKRPGAVATQALVELAHAIRSSAPVPIEDALERAAVTPEVKEIIRACLQKEAMRRPTPAALVSALLPLELEYAVSAMSLSGRKLVVSTAPPPARSRSWLVWAGAGAIALGGGLAWWKLGSTDGGLQRRSPTEARAPWTNPLVPRERVEEAPSESTADEPATGDSGRPRGPHAMAPAPTPSRTIPAPSAQPASSGTSWDPMSYR